MSKTEFEIDCKPSKNRKKVVITIIGTNVFGVKEMINVLANFIKHQIESNGISYEDAKIQKADEVRVLKNAK